jgi:hypothetical protein
MCLGSKHLDQGQTETSSRGSVTAATCKEATRAVFPPFLQHARLRVYYFCLTSIEPIVDDKVTTNQQRYQTSIWL